MPERADISLRGLLIGAAIVAAGIAFSLIAAALIAAHVPASATGASGGEPPRVEGVTLQTAAGEDLRVFLREKEARLESSGRVDDTHVHIPIERAMQILSQGRER